MVRQVHYERAGETTSGIYLSARYRDAQWRAR